MESKNSCELCESTKGVNTFTVSSNSESITIDLCARHQKPLLNKKWELGLDKEKLKDAVLQGFLLCYSDWELTQSIED